MRPVLTVRHVGKSFASKGDRISVLHDISFSLDEGEMLGIVGVSGCGKSTLLSIVAGLAFPDAGEIVLSLKEGGTLAVTSPERCRYMQLVVQEAAEMFSPRMTIGAFLREPMQNFGLKYETWRSCFLPSGWMHVFWMRTLICSAADSFSALCLPVPFCPRRS